MDALTGEYLPIANSTNLPDKTYYADGQKPQKTTSQTKDDPVKLNISPDAQALVTQPDHDFQDFRLTPQKFLSFFSQRV